MNPIAKELNKLIQDANPNIYDMLSSKGKNLFFPKGILSQSAEAKKKAFKLNATLGMATEKGAPMCLPSVMDSINLTPDQSITYAPSFGVPALRERWQTHIFTQNPSLAGKKVSLPVVTNAITHGLSVTADMWIDEDDVIVLPDLHWGNYNMIFTVLHGARVSHFTLFSSQGGFNLKAFEDVLKKETVIRKKIIVLLNFPNNPTGYTPTKEEGKRISEILINLAESGKNVLVIADDAYFGLFYEPNSMKESIFSLLAGSHERIMAIKLDGATKEDYVWGLRVGFITYGAMLGSEHDEVCNALEKKTAGAVRGSISNCSHLSQSIILKSLTSDNYKAEKKAKFSIMINRAKKLMDVLGNEKYKGVWDAHPFNSGYFICLKLKSIDAEKLRLHLLEKYGTGIIATTSSDIRVAFSSVEEENIEELFEIIFQGIKDLEQDVSAE